MLLALLDGVAETSVAVAEYPSGPVTVTLPVAIVAALIPAAL
jgi:hypothetical protein